MTAPSHGSEKWDALPPTLPPGAEWWRRRRQWWWHWRRTALASSSSSTLTLPQEAPNDDDLEKAFPEVVCSGKQSSVTSRVNTNRPTITEPCEQPESGMRALTQGGRNRDGAQRGGDGGIAHHLSQSHLPRPYKQGLSNAVLYLRYAPWWP